MTDPKELLARVRAGLDGVTPGPWTPERDECRFDTLSNIRGGAKRDVRGISSQFMVSVGGFAEWKEQEANARFIASSRSDVPELADALEAVIAERDHANNKWDEVTLERDAAEAEAASLKAEVARLRVEVWEEAIETVRRVDSTLGDSFDDGLEQAIIALRAKKEAGE